MALAYFGSNGAYMTDSTISVAPMQVRGNYGTYSYGGGLNVLGATDIGLAYNQQSIMQTSTSSLSDLLEKASKPAKRVAKGVLSKLRAEIDDWHGDILERCPA